MLWNGGEGESQTGDMLTPTSRDVKTNINTTWNTWTVTDLNKKLE